jgi:hypothetical protein
MKRKAPLKSARRQACGNVDNASALPTVPQAEQKQKKRTYVALPKPDNFIRYRQCSHEEIARAFQVLRSGDCRSDPSCSGAKRLDFAIDGRWRARYDP